MVVVHLNLVVVVNRPGVAGAVLQTALSLINSLSDGFLPDLHHIITPTLLEPES